jgi:VWFA-related protein
MRHSWFLRVLLFFALTTTQLTAQKGGGGRGSAPASSTTAAPYVGPYSTTPNTILPGAHADDEKKVEFKSEIVLVQVPAVVTDKAGNHIHALKKEDFKVEENGKEQRIAVFDEVTATNARLLQPANPPGTFSNLAQTGNPPRNVAVIALDTINTPFLDQTYGRQQLVKYLADNLDSVPVLAMVVIGSKGVRTISGITADPASLLNALKKVRGEMPSLQGVDIDSQALAATGGGATGMVPLLPLGGDPTAQIEQFVTQGDAVYAGYQQARAIENTMRAFLYIAWSLSGIPGRKSLIWATGGFPFYMDSPAAVPGGYLSVLYERAMEALSDAQVSVYPVDVRGLVSYSPVADGNARGPMSGPALVTKSTNRSWLQASKISTLQEFAAMTGGRAFYNSNDLTSGFKRAIEDSTSYYLLGYYLDTHNTKPGWRKLQVKLQHKDGEVRARSGFLVTNATMNPAISQQGDLGNALSSPFDSTGIPLTVQWRGTMADGNKKKVAFALHMPATGITIEGDRNAFDVDFVGQAQKDAALPTNVGGTAKGTLTAEALAKIKADGIFYGSSFDLPAGDYQVKFVVRDNLSGRIGSVTAPLTVN